MHVGAMAIGDLADAAGLSRRTVRFYVQQGLLPAPLGVGRGRHYDASHLERLRQIASLQAAGHSLNAIRRILNGGAADEATAAVKASGPAASAPKVAAELWTRVRIGEGLELHFDATRYQPPAAALAALREAIRDVFGEDAERPS